jgi:hypothetical protein
MTGSAVCSLYGLGLAVFMDWFDSLCGWLGSLYGLGLQSLMTGLPVDSLYGLV